MNNSARVNTEKNYNKIKDFLQSSTNISRLILNLRDIKIKSEEAEAFLRTGMNYRWIESCLVVNLYISVIREG